jgi:hypothetical protein
LLIVQAITLSFVFLSTGILSQVSIDSLIEAFQETIFQSTGIFSQGFTSIISHNFKSSIFTFLYHSQTLIKACFGVKVISFLMASFVFAFDVFSKYFQKHTNVNKRAETSK